MTHCILLCVLFEIITSRLQILILEKVKNVQNFRFLTNKTLHLLKSLAVTTVLTLSLLLGLPCPGTVFLYPSGTVVSKNALFSLFSVFFKQFVIVAGKKHPL